VTLSHTRGHFSTPKREPSLPGHPNGVDDGNVTFVSNAGQLIIDRVSAKERLIFRDRLGLLKEHRGRYVISRIDSTLAELQQGVECLGNH